MHKPFLVSLRINGRRYDVVGELHGTDVDGDGLSFYVCRRSHGGHNVLVPMDAGRRPFGRGLFGRKINVTAAVRS